MFQKCSFEYEDIEMKWKFYFLNMIENIVCHHLGTQLKPVSPIKDYQFYFSWRSLTLKFSVFPLFVLSNILANVGAPCITCHTLALGKVIVLVYLLRYPDSLSNGTACELVTFEFSVYDE